MGRAVQIYGIRYGLRGFYSRDAKPMELKAQAVEGIHLQGGTVLVCPLAHTPLTGVRCILWPASTTCHKTCALV